VATSKGSEEIAVRALQQGASSYVPKSMLSDILIETVHDVLAVSVEQRSHEDLLNCMVRSQCEFVLGNDTRLFFPLITFLQGGAVRMGCCDDTDKVRLGVALEEALTNALYHGNLEVDSDLRGEDHHAYRQLVDERKRLDPYRQRQIFVSARFSRQEVSVTIRDEGPGFDPACLPDPTEPENLEKCSGRGLLLMKTFMDEIRFNDRGNEVTLVKRVSSNDLSTTPDQ
jgi:anti-sigma regulatory factor (Ser/Thr protein kinase)